MDPRKKHEILYTESKSGLLGEERSGYTAMEDRRTKSASLDRKQRIKEYLEETEAPES